MTTAKTAKTALQAFVQEVPKTDDAVRALLRAFDAWWTSEGLRLDPATISAVKGQDPAAKAATVVFQAKILTWALGCLQVQADRMTAGLHQGLGTESAEDRAALNRGLKYLLAQVSQWLDRVHVPAMKMASVVEDIYRSAGEAGIILYRDDDPTTLHLFVQGQKMRLDLNQARHLYRLLAGELHIYDPEDGEVAP